MAINQVRLTLQDQLDEALLSHVTTLTELRVLEAQMVKRLSDKEHIKDEIATKKAQIRHLKTDKVVCAIKEFRKAKNELQVAITKSHSINARIEIAKIMILEVHEKLGTISRNIKLLQKQVKQNGQVLKFPTSI